MNAQAVTAYLNAQIDAGAQAVQIFDTWGGTLSDAAFDEFSLAYSRQVLAGLTREREGRVVPRILFTKGGGQWLEAMAGLRRRCAGRRLDHRPRRRARARRRQGRPAGQHGPDGALRLARRPSQAEAQRILDASARVRATFSTSATGSRSTRRRSTSTRSSRRSMRAPWGPHRDRWCQEKYLPRSDCLFTQMALQGLWGSFFSRSYQGKAMRRWRGVFSRIALVVGTPIPAAQVTPRDPARARARAARRASLTAAARSASAGAVAPGAGWRCLRADAGHRARPPRPAPAARSPKARAARRRRPPRAASPAY